MPSRNNPSKIRYHARRVARAINVPGIRPAVHAQFLRELATANPTLVAALIDLMMELGEDVPTVLWEAARSRQMQLARQQSAFDQLRELEGNSDD